jgi:hypothetical protein
MRYAWKGRHSGWIARAPPCFHCGMGSSRRYASNGYLLMARWPRRFVVIGSPKPSLCHLQIVLAVLIRSGMFRPTHALVRIFSKSLRRHDTVLYGVSRFSISIIHDDDASSHPRSPAATMSSLGTVALGRVLMN